MTTNIETPNTQHNGRTIAGIIIVIIGGIFLIDQLDLFFVPSWLFSWPMWMIGYGLYMGGKYNFKKPIWIWITVIGLAFLFTENLNNAERFVWPISIIGVGTWMVLKQRKPVNVHTDSYRYPGNNYKEI